MRWESVLNAVLYDYFKKPDIKSFIADKDALKFNQDTEPEANAIAHTKP